jgi:uncharacterized protein (TIGR02147 family)
MQPENETKTTNEAVSAGTKPVVTENGAPVRNAETGKISVSSPQPSVAEYDCFREYLSDWFAWKKTRNPSYSGALFAQQAGLSAHTFLGMVIRGQRNLGHDAIRAFVRALELNGREAIYFEKLVLFNQAKKADDKAYYLEQLQAVSGRNQKLVTRIKNHAEYLSHWYNAAIRELVGLKSFKADPEWISAKLKNRITKKQAKDAWQLLIDLGMVEKSADGWRPVDPALDIDPEHVDFAVRNYHKDYLDRTRQAIDDEPIAERELSSLTIAVTKADIPRIREKIKEFRKALNVEYPEGAYGEREHVLAINMQCLTLTANDSGQKQERTKQ